MRVICTLLIALFLVAGPSYHGYACANAVVSADFDGAIGFFAKNLSTGQTIEYNKDDIFPTASTSKLAVALAVYKYLYPAAPSEVKAEYDEAIELMMRISDNRSFYELLDEIDHLNFNPLDNVVLDLSLYRTKIHSPEAYQAYGYHSVTTPYEMASLFESIYRESYLDPRQSLELKEALAGTIFKDELPRFLPGIVMHKIGQLDDVLCDVGVVDDGVDQILISVYTRTDRCEEYASDYIANTAAALYTALKSPRNCC